MVTFWKSLVLMDSTLTHLVITTLKSSCETSTVTGAWTWGSKEVLIWVWQDSTDDSQCLLYRNGAEPQEKCSHVLQKTYQITKSLQADRLDSQTYFMPTLVFLSPSVCHPYADGDEMHWQAQLKNNDINSLHICYSWYMEMYCFFCLFFENRLFFLLVV